MDEKLALSVEEAARRINIGKNAVYELAKAGKIPAIRVGRRYIISAEQLDSWFQEQCASRAEFEL